jgi:plastocyanin
MSSKPLFAAALVALSLGLVACGDSGSDSSSTEAETSPSAQEETSPPPQEDERVDEDSADNEIVPGSDGESEPAPSGEASKSEKVDIIEFTYQPDPVVVQAGGKVVWQNQDAAPHTATADDERWDTGTIEKGKIGSETFKETGTFAYYCEIHPDMRGTVEVVE